MKETMGMVSIAIMLIAYGNYAWQTKKGSTRPHPFSWFLWSLVAGTEYLIQRAQHAGAGSWLLGFVSISCLFLGVLSLTQRRWKKFIWSDWVALGFGVLALAFYLLTKKDYPATSAIMTTMANVLGYVPTLTKGWKFPETDSATTFYLSGAKFVPSLFAMGMYSVATCLYPATIIVVNSCVATMLLLRRRRPAVVV